MTGTKYVSTLLHLSPISEVANEGGNPPPHPFGNRTGLITATGGGEEEGRPLPYEFYLAGVSDIVTDLPYLSTCAIFGLGSTMVSGVLRSILV